MAKYEQRCSFCGKEKNKTKKLIAGPDGIFICDECIELCNDMMAKTPSNSPAEQIELKKPAEGARRVYHRAGQGQAGALRRRL